MEPDILLPGNSVDISNQLPDINSLIGDILGPFIWVSVALTILLLVFYIHSMIRRRKVERAVLDIHKIVNEMNERDKARFRPPTQELPKNNDGIIAQTSSESIESPKNQA